MKPVLTIDGLHSLDLDDGVWAEPEGDRIQPTIATATAVLAASLIYKRSQIVITQYA